MQIVTFGDNLHELPKLFSEKKIRKIFQNVVCWKFYYYETRSGPNRAAKMHQHGDDCKKARFNPLSI